MAGKGRGWHGDSRLHSLAQKGISTKIDNQKRFAVNNYVSRGHVNYDTNGNIMVSEGLLSDLGEKLQTGLARTKVGILGTKEEKKALKEEKTVETFQKKAQKTSINTIIFLCSKPIFL